MMLDGNLEINDKNKVILKDKIPKISYNRKLYEIIQDMKKDEISLKAILKSVCYISLKKLKSIINLLENQMLEDKFITLEIKKRLIGSKKIMKINEDQFNEITEEIRLELLEENLNEKIILLASLLNSTKFLKNIFNKYEREKLNNILKEMKDTDIAKSVKMAQSIINYLHSIVAGAMINSTIQ